MDDNLNSHKIIDTFYMTDEQIEKAKKIDKENSIIKNVKKFFLGCAATILLGVGGMIGAEFVASPLLASLITIVPPGISAILTMKTFLKVFKGGEEVRREVFNETPEENSEEMGGKHR